MAKLDAESGVLLPNIYPYEMVNRVRGGPRRKALCARSDATRRATPRRRHSPHTPAQLNGNRKRK